MVGRLLVDDISAMRRHVEGHNARLKLDLEVVLTHAILDLPVLGEVLDEVLKRLVKLVHVLIRNVVIFLVCHIPGVSDVDLQQVVGGMPPCHSLEVCKALRRLTHLTAIDGSTPGSP